MFRRLSFRLKVLMLPFLAGVAFLVVLTSSIYLGGRSSEALTLSVPPHGPPKEGETYSVAQLDAMVARYDERG